MLFSVRSSRDRARENATALLSEKNENYRFWLELCHACELIFKPEEPEAYQAICNASRFAPLGEAGMEARLHFARLTLRYRGKVKAARVLPRIIKAEPVPNIYAERICGLALQCNVPKLSRLVAEVAYDWANAIPDNVYVQVSASLFMIGGGHSERAATCMHFLLDKIESGRPVAPRGFKLVIAAAHSLGMGERAARLAIQTYPHDKDLQAMTVKAVYSNGFQNKFAVTSGLRPRRSLKAILGFRK